MTARSRRLIKSAICLGAGCNVRRSCVRYRVYTTVADAWRMRVEKEPASTGECGYYIPKRKATP